MLEQPERQIILSAREVNRRCQPVSCDAGVIDGYGLLCQFMRPLHRRLW